MANKVEKAVVLRYNGQNYENPADVRKALRQDILGHRIQNWGEAHPDWKGIGEVGPLLEEYLADQWDSMEREVSAAMAGTGID